MFLFIIQFAEFSKSLVWDLKKRKQFFGKGFAILLEVKIQNFAPNPQKEEKKYICTF